MSAMKRAFQRTFILHILTAACLFSVASCTTKYLKIENEEKLKKNDEFENVVQISDPSVVEGLVAETPIQTVEETKSENTASSPPKKITKDENKSSKTITKKNVSPPVVESKISYQEKQKVPLGKEAAPVRQPEMEDSEGFSGRRPIVDPFRVGEEVVHSVRYFKVQAGSLKFKVEPFVQVNQRKSYTFAYEIQTSSLFSSFYSVQDRAVVLVDFLELIPRVFTLHVKESGQLREARSFFDFDKLKAIYWEKKYTKKDGHEEKKEEWDILAYSQNVFSAAFYMRTFQWHVGKEIAFRVSDNKENLVFKGQCIREDTLETEAGQFNALVIKPEITLKGKFKPVGDIFIWLSNDDRKYILRVESSIKIGTIVSEIIKLNPGQQ